MKWLVTTFLKGRDRTFVWDGNSPINLDPEYKWILDGRPSGIWIRYLGGKSHDSVSGEKLKSIKVDPAEMRNSNQIELHEDFHIQFSTLKTIHAPYRAEEFEPIQSGGKWEVLAYFGVGKSLINAYPFDVAYVGFGKTHPLFTVTLAAEDRTTVEIEPLSDEIAFKMKGQASTLGQVGEKWTIPLQDLPYITLSRGKSWWRFNILPLESPLPSSPEWDHLYEDENRHLGHTILGSLLVLGAFFEIIFLLPQSKKQEPPTDDTPVVTFVAPKIETQPLPQLKLPEKKPEEKKPEVKKVEEPKPEEKKPKPIEPKKLPVKVTHSKPQLPKPVVPKPPQQAEAISVKHDSPPNSGTQKLTEVREALGGLMSLKDSSAPLSSAPLAPSSRFSSKKGTSGIITSDIKADYAPAQSDIAGLGGHGGTGGGNGVGYASGKRVQSGSGSGTFVEVGLDEISTQEGLTKEEIGAIIHKHLAEVRYCHETSMINHPNISGRIVVQFTIGRNGHVKKASVSQSSVADPQLAQCLIRKLEKWAFPEPKGGVEVEVSYPFSFKTLGED